MATMRRGPAGGMRRGPGACRARGGPGAGAAQAGVGVEPVAALGGWGAPQAALGVAAVGAGAWALAKGVYGLASGSRKYDGNVGEEYDAWTEEGILEHYWGEHIHLGYYTRAERAKGYKKKDFIAAKYDFVDRMPAFSQTRKPRKILDVGCGIGGTSRYLAKAFPDAEVTGITISPQQVARATELAREQGVDNVKFELVDALKLSGHFPADEFDLVWACESGEHMPDKRLYVEEMVKVLKPEGDVVIACWCQREDTPERPLTAADREELKFLYEEWAHPYFISIQEFERLLAGTGAVAEIRGDDWVEPTLASWRHSIWVGVYDPWPVVFAGFPKFWKAPRIWYKTTREIVTLERMHQAFASGLMEYGLIRGKKKAAAPAAPAAEVDVSGLSWSGEASTAAIFDEELKSKVAVGAAVGDKSDDAAWNSW